MSDLLEKRVGDIPDPLGAIAQHHLLFGAIPTPFEGFGIKPAPKQLGRFNCPGVSGGSGIPNRSTLWVGCGLGEDRPEFDFPGASRLPRGSAGAPLQLSTHHRQLGAIHLDIQHGDGGTEDVGECQLHDAISVGLFPADNVATDGFGVALHSFGGDLKARQQVQLLAASDPAYFPGNLLLDCFGRFFSAAKVIPPPAVPGKSVR